MTIVPDTPYLPTVQFREFTQSLALGTLTFDGSDFVFYISSPPEEDITEYICYLSIDGDYYRVHLPYTP